ncbi:MAG: diguanylate cyclase, partial [Thiomicrorhabdus sp.]|nr:diguanylate cyclase [Thiomicrorhabdus sp.]
MPLEIFKKSSSKPSLKSTMLLGAVVTALIVFVVTLITASQIFTRSITQQGVDNAHVISRLTFDNMYQIMSQGWNRTELLRFREDLQKSYQAENLKVWIYRANLVNQQFGELPSVIPDDSLQQFQAVAHNASAQIIRHDNSIRLLEPIKATEQCIACHTQAKKGDVLGVMAIEQDIGLILKPARFDFVFLMLLLLPIPIILAWWVGKKFSKSLLSSVNEINKEILSIHQIDDLSKLTYKKSVFDYLEFEQLQGSLNQLGQKIKNIAIDRDILDFEIQLLDKLILSSEIIKDWKQHICQLMMEINRILPLYALFVVFRTDDAEHYVIEFFWLGRPSEEAMEHMQKFAQKTLADVSIFEEGSIYKMNHTFASQEPMDVKKDIQTQSKSLMLDHPRIGGVVGLGVETLPPKESSRSIVVESILTTLINVIGSIKAINKFTKELEYYATRDPLTHLFNQRVFHEMLSYEIRRSEQREYSFGLLMIDFDNFKLINDQYGHAFGDDVLIAFANKIKEAIRQGDIFARYGGDEFCVILPESDENIVREIGQKILDATDSIRLQTPQKQIVKIACSIGASLYPDHAQNKEDLFMVADNMLYRVKDHGKNALSYPLEPDLIEVYKESNDQSTFIMNALETGEAIEAHYQPIVSLNNGEVQVHELLMRLRQDGELISASRFIETAEHMGLV